MGKGEAKVECPLCGFRCWGASALARHQGKKHTPCPHCDRSFIKLPMHIRLKHPEEEPGA